MPDRSRDRSRRFVVVGCGSIGQRHIANLQELEAGAVVGVDIDAERKNEVLSKFGVESFTSLEEALDETAAAVFITAPTSAHVPLALEAARRGVPLFIEKPLGDRRDGVDELLAVVTEHDLVSLVACNMRFHPGVATVKRLIDEGAVGAPLSARAEFGQYLPDWHPHEDYRRSYSARREIGGGVTLDAIHEIDYVRWMMGDVAAVTCFHSKLSNLDIETEDTAAILLRFASGAIGEVHLDYVQRAYRRSCAIIGEEGTIRWSWESRAVRAYSAQTGEWTSVPEPRGWEPNHMYLDELRHFLRCLDRAEEPMLSVAEGARVLDVALAAKESAAAGTVVRLDTAPGEGRGHAH